jgi:hypothetical protein
MRGKELPMSMVKYSVPDIRGLQVEELEKLKKRQAEIEKNLDKLGAETKELGELERNLGRQKEVTKAIAEGDVAEDPF